MLLRNTLIGQQNVNMRHRNNSRQIAVPGMLVQRDTKLIMRTTKSVFLWSVFVAVVFAANMFAIYKSAVKNEIFNSRHTEPWQPTLGNHGAPKFTNVTELDHLPDSKEFYSKFVYKRVPVVFRGIANNKKWTFTESWKNISYLNQSFGDVKFETELRKYSYQATGHGSIMKLRDFLSSFKTKDWYIMSPVRSTKMLADLMLPKVLGCPEIYKKIKSTHFLMSSGNTSSPLHIDGLDNLMVMISGNKTFILYEPRWSAHLLGENAAGVSRIDPSVVDFTNHEILQIRSIPFYSVTIRPGDLLYVPQFWWHQVRSDGNPNIAVQFWWQQFDFSDKLKQISPAQISAKSECFHKELQKQARTVDCPGDETATEDYFKHAYNPQNT